MKVAEFIPFRLKFIEEYGQQLIRLFMICIITDRLAKFVSTTATFTAAGGANLSCFTTTGIYEDIGFLKQLPPIGSLFYKLISLC